MGTVKAQVRDLRYNSGNLYPNCIIRHMLTKWTDHPPVTADMQTGWEPLAALIGANSSVGWAALYLASYIYICTLCS